MDIIKIVKEVIKKVEEEKEKDKELEREKWLEEIGYTTKDGDYFSDVIRRRIHLDKAYMIVNNILIEQKETLTEKEIEYYEHQKELLENLIIYFYMTEKGWIKDGTNNLYKREEEIEV